jgi:hypothetical protein
MGLNIPPISHRVILSPSGYSNVSTLKPIVGIVCTISPNNSLYRNVVFPDASFPSTRPTCSVPLFNSQRAILMMFDGLIEVDNRLSHQMDSYIPIRKSLPWSGELSQMWLQICLVHFSSNNQARYLHASLSVQSGLRVSTLNRRDHNWD